MKITLGVIAFQNDFVSKHTVSSACSSVTFGNSAVILRDVKSGSNTTLTPAIFAIVSNTTFASLVIFKLISSAEIGFSTGACSSICSSSGGAVFTLGEFAASRAARASIVRLTIWSAATFDGSSICAFWNSASASCKSPFLVACWPFSMCPWLASKRAWVARSLYSGLLGSARRARSKSTSAVS